MQNRNESTYCLLVFKPGAEVEQHNGLTRKEAMQYADEAQREGATRSEIWDEYTDQLWYAFGR
jgi:hypothetical protein